MTTATTSIAQVQARDLEAIIDAADAVEPAATATSGVWSAARR